MAAAILVIGTLDTKGEEFEYLCTQISARGHPYLVMDVGVMGVPKFQPHIAAAEVASAAGHDLQALRERADRGEALAAMAQGARLLATRLFNQGKLAGVVSLGGSGGTSIATAAMQALPVGIPKVMVSTMASGDIRPYVGAKDIAMLYSVVDIAGLNRVARQIFDNAAGAICGMVEQRARQTAHGSLAEKPLIGATMFGVTTPCVTQVRQLLEEKGFEVLVFHATGSGGRAMETLIQDRFFAGIADITTTELADELVGGILSAGPHRLEAAAHTGTPQVVSLGALDMVNFGPLETVPAPFRGRRLYQHNPTVTLMRTTPAECASLGTLIASKLNRSIGPTALLVPLRGISMIDAPGQPFHDPEADEALIQALRTHLDRKKVTLVELDLHINDPAFAQAVVTWLLRLMQPGQGEVTAAGSLQ
ncbi:Tm-1-like ATP-binding domain-containing protein [Litorilinea aerophila]|uniref:UPF0261 family protein n=1 Tax=Litorilinea aerophila TaxID=1204385 RepID=A0A540VA13_9CHLR|nr:Tm-1-like ATP-binding domain-containing protein [Litorilinea aerophila]MCC9078549.1 Tm-1-like ATP-binding domain-containing protein [Litorilinea aerophila]